MTRRWVSSSFALVILATAIGTAAPARADLVDTTVDGNSLAVKVRLPGVGADVTVTFEQVVGLSPENLGISARLLTSADLVQIASRLPSPQVSVPAGFPLLLTIEPPPSGGLSFSGVVTIELYTHDLVYVPGSPLRLFSAPLGGPFRDITESASAGSYRVRGRKGEFCEFLIISDLRPVDSVIAAKLARLRGELDDFGTQIEPAELDTLDALLSDVEAAVAAGDTVTAIEKTEAFETEVHTASGSEIPDVWRSAGDLTDVAGRLRADASTLRYSLLLKDNGAS